MTKYKYQAREKEDIIDWDEVGSKISKTLDDIGTEREEKRQGVEDDLDTALGILDDAPLGEHKGVNAANIESTQKIKNFLLMNNKLLKSGKMKYDDYQRLFQNVNDGATNYIEIIKGYNEQYKNHLDMYEKDPSARSAWDMEQTDGFLNFQGSELSFDAKGNVVMMKYDTDEEGNRTYTGEVESLSALKNRSSRYIPSFKVEENLKKSVDRLATKYKSLVSADGTRVGGIRNWTDVRTNNSYKEAKKNTINSHLDNPNNIQSILTDYLVMDKDGNDYVLSKNPEDEGSPNVIFMKYNNNSGDYEPAPTDKQRQIAFEAMDAVFESMIDREFEQYKEFAPPKPAKPATPKANEWDTTSQVVVDDAHGNSHVTDITPKGNVYIPLTVGGNIENVRVTKVYKRIGDERIFATVNIANEKQKNVPQSFRAEKRELTAEDIKQLKASKVDVQSALEENVLFYADKDGEWHTKEEVDMLAYNDDQIRASFEPINAYNIDLMLENATSANREKFNKLMGMNTGGKKSLPQ